MKNKVSCPHCQNFLECESEWIGMQVTCPICHQDFVVPRQSADGVNSEPATSKNNKKIWIICAVVLVFAVCIAVTVIMMSVFFGSYFYLQKSQPQPDLETPRIFMASQAYAAGNFLKKDFGGKRLYLVVDTAMKDHEFTKTMVETLTRTYGSAPTVITPGTDCGPVLDPLSFTAKQYNEIFDQCKGGVIVCTLSLMGDPKMMNGINVLKAKSGTAVFFTNPEPSKMVAKMIKDGRIAGVCCGTPGKIDPEFKPTSRDLQGAFDSRYIVVSKDNIQEYKDLFMF